VSPGRERNWEQRQVGASVTDDTTCPLKVWPDISAITTAPKDRHGGNGGRSILSPTAIAQAAADVTHNFVMTEPYSVTNEEMGQHALVVYRLKRRPASMGALRAGAVVGVRIQSAAKRRLNAARLS
jgi:hypothetical protein